jgi:ABC-type polysaccharide/polyol phosphate transport system ATPase subunit
MSPSGTLVADRLWKRFRADQRRTLLRDELERLRRGRHGDRRGWRWALRDITFDIKPGDSVGMVGTNGSGKTTLLKILAGVMYPYAGRMEVSGRLGPLIDLRAGLHPDLTGRENVYISGSLFGLSRKEITRRFDEVVAFAELEDAIGRQVKFYSSGMQLRLGFAIVTATKPDILLVDEVLGVGDAAFQQKCLDRTRDMILSGTTLIYVAHDLASVEGMCRKGLWLRDGVVQERGEVRGVIGAYRRWIEELEGAMLAEARKAGVARLIKAEVTGPQGDGCRTDGPIEIRTIIESGRRTDGTLYVGISEGPGTPIFVTQHALSLRDGQTEARCSIPHLPLPGGRFFAWVAVMGTDGRELLPWQPATNFDVSGPNLDPTPQGVIRLAPVQVRAAWDVDGRS